MKYLLALLVLLALRETYLGPPTLRWDCDFEELMMWPVRGCPICRNALDDEEMANPMPESDLPGFSSLDSIYLACKTLHRRSSHPKYLALLRLSPFTNIEDCQEHCEVQLNGTCIEASFRKRHRRPIPRTYGE